MVKLAPDKRASVDRNHSEGPVMRRWRNGRRVRLKPEMLQVRLLHAAPV